MKKASVMMSFIFLGLFETPVINSEVIGDWVSCRLENHSSYLYLTRFEQDQRIEVFALSDAVGCKDFSKRVKAALVIRWNYQVHGDEIHHNLISEKVAIFDFKLAQKYKLSDLCAFKSWSIHLNEDCLIDASEFPHLQGLRENRTYKKVKLKLSASKRLQLSDGLGDELIKWEKP
jgi:hypothetical protein